MSLLASLAAILGIVNGLANLPQIIKIFKTKKAKDLSIITNIVFLISSVVWLLYGIEMSNAPIIISNVIYFLTYIMIVVGYYVYK